MSKTRLWKLWSRRWLVADGKPTGQGAEFTIENAVFYEYTVPSISFDYRMHTKLPRNQMCLQAI
jgi:hypothetical protein